jgi:hypothetical protein
MRHQSYMTTAVLIAVKARKKTVGAAPVMKAIPLRKPQMSKIRVAEDGSIIRDETKVLTVIN